MLFRPRRSPTQVWGRKPPFPETQVVVIAMGTSNVSFIKLFGIGLTMAVLVDATLIRAALKRIYRRWGFSETGAEARGREMESVR